MGYLGKMYVAGGAAPVYGVLGPFPIGAIVREVVFSYAKAAPSAAIPAFGESALVSFRFLADGNDSTLAARMANPPSALPDLVGNLVPSTGFSMDSGSEVRIPLNVRVENSRWIGIQLDPQYMVNGSILVVNAVTDQVQVV